MCKDKKNLLAINLAGGIAVIASYLWGVLAYPENSRLLWGTTPTWLIPIFTTNMLLAALGYLIFTTYLIFILDLSRTQVNIGKGFRGFHVLFLLVLVPSALWMPLTMFMLDTPSNGLWIAIRFVLLLVGLGGLGLLSALLSIKPRSRMWLLSFIGCILFCIQVVLLDAFIWPSFFTIP